MHWAPVTGIKIIFYSIPYVNSNQRFGAFDLKRIRLGLFLLMQTTTFSPSSEGLGLIFQRWFDHEQLRPTHLVICLASLPNVNLFLWDLFIQTKMYFMVSYKEFVSMLVARYLRCHVWCGVNFTSASSYSLSKSTTVFSWVMGLLMYMLH